MTDFTGSQEQAGGEGMPGRRATRIDNAAPAARGPVDRDGGRAGSCRVDQGRDFADSILHRSEWLTPGDRQLLRSIYADGNAVARLAPMLRTPKRSLRRRVKRLLDRVNSRRFAFVAVRHNQWPAMRRRIACSVILQGNSLRETAQAMGMSLYSVRRHHDAINALFEASERA